MNNKKILPALLICILLFAVALALAVLFPSGETAPAGTVANSDVVISEIMSSNRTYPNAQGKQLDYIEIQNLSNKQIDISGYKLSDDESSIGFTFPQGAALEPYGYAVCWCDSSSSDEAYASFQLSKNGGETVYLYNSTNALIDQQLLPKVTANTPLIRQQDGTLALGTLGTPGYANTQEGYDAWLAAMGGTEMKVLISEVQTGNYCIALDDKGTVCDWVELYNAGSETAVLDGAYLSDDPADPLKWQIPRLILGPNEYALIPCSGTTAEGHASFALDRSGCTLVLTGAIGSELSRVECPQLSRGYAWAIQSDGSYAGTPYATPGFVNTETGYGEWLDSVGAEQLNVVISEVQTVNRSAITDSSGKLCDWVELYNAGTTAAVLDGAFLSDDPEDHIKWQIPSLTLAPGEYAVIKCVGAGAANGEADFTLDRDGCTLVLSGSVGNIITQTECPFLSPDRSWAILEDGSYTETELLSPGYPNTADGCSQFRSTQKPTGGLMISEVMPSNNRYLLQTDGEYYDWIELVNISASPIDLADYTLSDTADDLGLLQLPNQILQPGQRVVVICSGNTALTGSYIQAPFTLSREECWVYVSHKDGSLSDYIRVSKAPYQGSVGRNTGDTTVVYFTTPTPGEENISGVAQIAEVPFVKTPGGIYNGVESVSVVLSGEGQIYYTLDGSEPTQASPVYTAPIILTKSTSLRAVCFSEGKLPSNIVTASYIINENHTLPVVTITADPQAMFGNNGIYTRYTRDIEIPCNLTLYEADAEGFTVDCGVKLHGHTGLTLDKKSFKINFRSRYGTDVLGYPVFGEEGLSVFDALCIRAGQDYPQSIFREELFSSLCQDMSDNVLTQDNKFCILYINGEYWGIYNLKEAFTEEYYAQHRNVSAESVTIVQAPVDYGTEIHQFMQFLKKQRMADDANYEYAASVINVESLIDWMIIQGYCTNGDVQQNLRYFRSTENGNRWEMAFYDLDWAFYRHRPFANIIGHEFSWQHMMITNNMMNNAQFRQQFLERLSYHMGNALSNQNVLARIDYFEQLLLPEIPRERDRWGGTLEGWKNMVQRLRNFITNNDHLGDIVDHLKVYIGLTSNEIETYFKEWD
ncbi:MAG: lamin tail domain-containing protein [Oscillospiraceae bacterium]|nr:lamin tail domain-containing protein [Oscillospiraceae bacterium]